MKFTATTKKGEISNTRGAVKAYRQTPGSLNAAVTAAAHYAKRDKKDMVVLAGNSYMSAVYHVAPLAKKVSSITAMPGKVGAVMVTPDGEVFEGHAA